LGLTLYEAVALRPAFAGSDRFQLIARVTGDDPPRLHRADPQVPRDLATIITKAIDKEPGRRYPTAAELAEDLQRFLEDRPIRARQAGMAERTWRWCRRNPAVATMSFAFVLALLVGLVGVTWEWRRAEANAAAAQANLDKVNKAGERLQEQLRQSLVNEARA